MSEAIESVAAEEFEYVFAGTGTNNVATTTCSTTDKCDKECVGGSASTSNMNGTMATA